MTIIMQKTVEKVTKYIDLKIEISKIWKVKAFIVPIVIADLGSFPKDLSSYLNQ